VVGSIGQPLVVLASRASCPLMTSRAFRTALHDCFDRRADALFKLVDTVLLAESVGSLPHLSVQASHRRDVRISTCHPIRDRQARAVGASELHGHPLVAGLDDEARHIPAEGTGNPTAGILYLERDEPPRPDK
jgi:hypothetical protein